MQCHDCHQEFSAAEVLKHEEQERDFEAFERSLYACSSADALEDVEIPDRVAPEAPGLTMVDGQVVVLTAWAQPQCDRCLALYWLEAVLFHWDGSYAYALMHAYGNGTHGCPQSPVMASSWALVLEQWYRHEEDHAEAVEARQLMITLESVLTAAEEDAAIGLAEDVFAIARTFGEFWALHDS